MKRTTFLVALIASININAFAQNQNSNILLIIADDFGIDMLSGFGAEGDKPSTPTLDSLREAGLAFTQCWATPQCSPTRSAIMSGKYGVNTGVYRPGTTLELEHTSIFNRIKQESELDYDMSVIGKWHVNSDMDYNHPTDHGVDHYEGVWNSGVDDYYSWTKTINGEQEVVDEYVTTHLTDAAIDWINDRDEPWFLWFAHAAPHGPFHLPPSELYTTEITDSTDDRQLYFAMVESMDHEIGRLIHSMDQQTRDNTSIIFIGDNGTPGPVNDYYPRGHVKSSIYEGGLRVPLIVSGKQVLRTAEIDESLVQAADIYATILELTGIQVPGGEQNSRSFKPLLSCDMETWKEVNYSDYNDDGRIIWATRNAQYKLIEGEDGVQEFYDISTNLFEEDNLIDILTPEQEEVKAVLEAEANAIRSGWSCHDGIRNGDETTIDDCDNDCEELDELSTENIGCCEEPSQPSVFWEFEEEGQRHLYTNSYPNHDFCFVNNRVPEPNYRLYRVDQVPALSGETTSVVRENNRPARFFGVALNGVFIMPAPATPFIFENQETGEFNWDWVFEPTVNQGEGQGFVSLDCSSAHTNDNGYHYHGNMFEYVEGIDENLPYSAEIPDAPVQVGWASDGFPIIYRFGPDPDGNIKELLPSYQLRAGLRPGDGITAPCGPYSGKYSADYEYICGKGDLDECNGIEASITLETALGEQTFDYYYVISSDYPQIGRCMKGFVSPDFDNGGSGLEGEDLDGDGFIDSYDCDDTNPDINPFAEEIEGNDVDENCDGMLTSTRELADLGITVGPNPNLGSLRIDIPSGQQYLIRLTDVKGIVMRQEQIQGQYWLHNLSPGAYYLQFVRGSRLVVEEKIIVN